MLDLQTALIGIIVILVLLWLMNRGKPDLKLPPGPRGLPFLGSVLSLGTEDEVPANISKMRTEYNSDIVHMKLGGYHTIVLYNLDLVKEAFCSKDFETRPKTFLTDLAGNHGIVSSSGDKWKTSRRYTLSVLRDFGMGKNRIEEIIHDEVYYLLKEIEKFGKSPFSPAALLQTSVSNIISTINFGERFEYGDKTFQWLLDSFQEDLELISKSQVLNYVPWIRFLPGDFFGYHQIVENEIAFQRYVQKIVEDHRATFDVDNIRDIIDACLVKQSLEGENSCFTDKQIWYIIGDLFFAGTETTSTTLRWLLLTMILRPDVQEKIHREIDSVIPRGRSPTMADKIKLPYTNAVISEVMRYFPLVHLGLPHSNVKQVKLGGYDIPENSVVMYSLMDIHKDQKYWPNPDKFDPEGNFLDASGNLVNNDNMIPFSIGKRVCIGEAMARMELFLFSASLLQKYTFTVDSSKSAPDFTPKCSIVYAPQEYTLVATPRE